VRAYLDYNATAPLRVEARQAMIAAMDVVGNPSSVHSEGRAAKALVERAREQVAQAVGCQVAEVVFTSGATEAARVLEGFSDVRVPPTAHDALWAHHQPGSGTDTVLAMGLANSETGIVTEPHKGAEGWSADGHAGNLLLLDITQAVGRLPFVFSWSGADLAILSGHKLGGPKGVGALIVRRGFDIPALSLGGGQEMGRRSGTENIIGIAGLGAAIEAAMQDLSNGVWERVEKLRNILETSLEARANKTIFVGKGVARLPNTSCFITDGWKGETQVMQMDLAGFAISAGSACSSGKVRESRVLRAMGFDAGQAASAVRVSLGPATTEDEVLRFVQAWQSKEQKFRARTEQGAA
jgi:cysteine desulfurase